MRREFEVTLRGDDSGKMDIAFIELPFDTREVWGKARVPVKVTVNGYTWRSTVANMHGCQYVPLNKTVRMRAGVKAGDRVTVTMEPDSEKREISIPPDLRKALGTNLAAKLERLAFTHKKEFVRWYTEAKKDETRLRRLEKMKQMLRTGKTIS